MLPFNAYKYLFSMEKIDRNIPGKTGIERAGCTA
jgi:hypothetical protein